MMFGLGFSILAGLCTALAADELFGWLDKLSISLLRWSAAKLPMVEAERFIEEWIQVYDSCPGRVSKLWFCLSIYIERSRIYQELSNKYLRKDVTYKLGKRPLSRVEGDASWEICWTVTYNGQTTRSPSKIALARKQDRLGPGIINTESK